MSDTRDITTETHWHSIPVDDGDCDVCTLIRERDELKQALAWALDILDVTFARLDTLEPPSESHMRMRHAGMKKARGALR